MINIKTNQATKQTKLLQLLGLNFFSFNQFQAQSNVQDNQLSTINNLAYKAVNLAEQIYNANSNLFPEVYYENLLYSCLVAQGIPVLKQFSFMPISNHQVYNSVFRCDLILGKVLLIEIKANNNCLPAFKSQLQIYQKLLGINHGLLINFAAPSFYNAINRYYIQY